MDERGKLVPIEFGALDFDPVHAFVVTGNDGAVRGGHAHRSGSQLLLRISGTIEVSMALGSDSATVQLDEVRNALLINSPVWSSQTYHGSEPAILVLSSTLFDPANYLNEAE
ncbi:MAG: FdtA/QdtA family cupin domain-containing protein [Halioglobus sp.]|nr:FdtA/QdtA family cupin domain-containing protein [Halioglobus sp.]